MRYGFIDEKALITMKLISSCQWTTLVKKWIFNANSDFLQNCTEKQIMPSETVVKLVIYVYLFIAYFHWKIGVFQQTVVRVYYILNKNF